MEEKLLCVLYTNFRFTSIDALLLHVMAKKPLPHKIPNIYKVMLLYP
jgi:hypothetical protein